MFVLPAPTTFTSTSSTASGGMSPSTDPEAFLAVLADALSAWVEDLSDATEGDEDADTAYTADAAATDSPDLTEIVPVELFVPIVGHVVETPTLTEAVVGADEHTEPDGAVDAAGGADIDGAAAPLGVDAPDEASTTEPSVEQDVPAEPAGETETATPDADAVDRSDGDVVDTAEGDLSTGRGDEPTPVTRPGRLVVDDPALTTVARPNGIEAGPGTPELVADGPEAVEETSFAQALLDAEADALDADDPWMQVARALRPLHRTVDGSHRIALQLRPAELGTVHLEVTLDDGRLSVRALVESAATRELLAGAVPELRDELTKAGIDLDSVDLGQTTADQGNPRSDGETTSAGGLGTPDAPANPGAGDRSALPSDPAPRPAAPGRLDLSL